jgi:hypothetical protein
MISLTSANLKEGLAIQSVNEGSLIEHGAHYSAALYRVIQKQYYTFKNLLLSNQARQEHAV